MWFKLAGADFSNNNLGTIGSISNSRLIVYNMTGMRGNPSSVLNNINSTSITITVTEGYVFKTGSVIKNNNGVTVYTAPSDHAGGTSFSFNIDISGSTGNIELIGNAQIAQ